VPVAEITGQLQQIVKEEKLDADDDALTLIARQATGSMRDAITLLDQLASTGQRITLELTQTVLGTAASQTVFDVMDAIMNQAPTPGLEAIHSALDSGTDARVLARQIVDYLRALLLAKMGNEASLDLTSDGRTQVRRHAQGFSAPELLRVIRLFNSAANDLRGGWQPSLTLELALAEAMEVPTVAESVPEAAEPAKAIKPQASQQTKIAKSEPVPAVVPDETTHEKGVTFEQVSKSWKQIRAIIKPKNPALEGLLNSCKLLGIKDGTLVLGFSSEVVKSKMDKPEQIEITSRAITEVLGVVVPVRCVVTSAKATPPHVKPDGMVAAALQNGGEIVDIQE
jgi:DNA polymerase-3 subunit gamma/tau